MKWSMFNSILPYEQEFALYNSFTQKVIFLASELKELLSAAIIEGIDGLVDYHPTFYNYLKEHEFLVESDCNEVDNVHEMSIKIDNNAETYMLTINPTMNCNFKCWYCYETHIKQSKLNNDIKSRLCKFIEKTVINYSSLQTFSLSFFGGEPLLYFEKTVEPIINFSKHICEQKDVVLTIGFTTNGYLINENILKYFSDNNLTCGFQITLDGYKDEHDKIRYVNVNKGSYSEIIKNIRLLILNKHFVRLRINYTNDNITNTHKIPEEFIDIAKEIRDEYLVFDFHRVWQNIAEGDINDLVQLNMEKIYDKGFIVRGNSSLNNVADPCYADKRHTVTVNYNGDIYKCTARDFTRENRAGYLNNDGELVWENNHLEKRMNIKFKNKPCQTCRILPLCGGGCSQHAIENEENDYCIYKGNEEEKNMVIKSKINDILKDLPKPVASS